MTYTMRERSIWRSLYSENETNARKRSVSDTVERFWLYGSYSPSHVGTSLR